MDVNKIIKPEIRKKYWNQKLDIYTSITSVFKKEPNSISWLFFYSKVNYFYNFTVSSSPDCIFLIL